MINSVLKVIMGSLQGLVYGLVLGQYLNLNEWAIVALIFIVGALWTIYLLEH